MARTVQQYLSKNERSGKMSMTEEERAYWRWVDEIWEVNPSEADDLGLPEVYPDPNHYIEYTE